MGFANQKLHFSVRHKSYVFSSLLGSIAGYKSDTKSFLFLLENKSGQAPEKLPKIDPSDVHSIYSHPNLGPTFGYGSDLHIVNQATSNKDSFVRIGFTYRPPKGETKGSTVTEPFIAGRYFYFQPDEIETFFETT